MPPLEPENAALVYPQDDAFVMTVGEPIELTRGSRIVVGKWDRVYAEALREICGRTFPEAAIEVCGEGQGVLRSLRERPVEYLVLGLGFGDVDGIDVLEENAREGLARRVFIVSSRKDEHTLRALRTARFDGFLDPTEEGGAALAQALGQVADGRGYISPALCRRFVERRAGVLTQRLTPAELLTFFVVGDGTEDRAAGEILGVSAATMQSHRRNLMRKLEVSTSAQLVREAARLGVVRFMADGAVIRPGFARLLEEWRARKNGKTEA